MTKRILPLILAILSAQTVALRATDIGGDGDYIPAYHPIVTQAAYPDYRQSVQTIRPKPTMAYYGKGFTVYYGYTSVPARTWDITDLYAFGYPVEFFNSLMPIAGGANQNLDRYAVEMKGTNVDMAGSMVADQQTKSTVTKVKTTASRKSAQELPAIGEGPH